MPHTLFEPFELSGLHLANRFVMAPMTRCRAGESGVPTKLMAEYYAQRATAGLIVTEGIVVSLQARGYLLTPGIYNQEQVSGWHGIATAVHAKNGVIFAQLWHVGRISHSSIQPQGLAPQGPSNIIAEGSNCFAYDLNGQQAYIPTSKPSPLSIAGITQVIEQFAQATANVRSAGLDGVEIHAANGYLFDQFLNSKVNNRTDTYGGSVEKRCRLLLEVVDAAAKRIGMHRVGVRISPYGQFNSMPVDPETEATFTYLVQELNRRNIAYLHINDQRGFGLPAIPKQFLSRLRTTFRGPLILCGGYDAYNAKQAMEDDAADLIGFGMLYLANPDLPARFEHNWPLNPYERCTFYGGGAKGYTDYPFYNN